MDSSTSKETLDEENKTTASVPDWHYAYMAGLVDHRGNIVVTVGKDDNHKIGFRIMVECRIKTERENSIEFLQSFFDAHDLPARQVTHDDQAYSTYEFVLSQRQAVKTFLELIRPYLVARGDAVDRLCTEIIPALEAGDHQQKKSFLELIQKIGQFRAAAGRGNRAKYDYDYFVEEWGIES